MAVIEKSGTVRHNPRCLGNGGGGLIGEITANFDELTRLFGPDDRVDEAPPGWVIRVESPDGRPTALVSLYCHGDTRPRAYRHSSFVFSLGAHRDQQWAADRVKATIAQYREDVKQLNELAQQLGVTIKER